MFQWVKFDIIPFGLLSAAGGILEPLSGKQLTSSSFHHSPRRGIVAVIIRLHSKLKRRTKTQ
jgi:hypothetical protein